MENTTPDKEKEVVRERKKYTHKYVDFYCPDCQRTLAVPKGFRLRCPDCAKRVNAENNRKISKMRSDENKEQADINRKLKERDASSATSLRAELERCEKEEARKLAIQQKQCVKCAYSSRYSSIRICNCLLITGHRAGKSEPGKCSSFTPKSKMTAAQIKAQQRKQISMTDAELAAESRANADCDKHQPLY